VSEFLGKWGGERGRERDVAKERKKNFLPLPIAREREEEDEQCHQNDAVFSFVFF
jgi:hypothetical protein